MNCEQQFGLISSSQSSLSQEYFTFHFLMFYFFAHFYLLNFLCDLAPYRRSIECLSMGRTKWSILYFLLLLQALLFPVSTGMLKSQIGTTIAITCRYLDWVPTDSKAQKAIEANILWVLRVNKTRKAWEKRNWCKSFIFLLFSTILLSTGLKAPSVWVMRLAVNTRLITQSQVSFRLEGV